MPVAPPSLSNYNNAVALPWHAVALLWLWLSLGFAVALPWHAVACLDMLWLFAVALLWLCLLSMLWLRYVALLWLCLLSMLWLCQGMPLRQYKQRQLAGHEA